MSGSWDGTRVQRDREWYSRHSLRPAEDGHSCPSFTKYRNTSLPPLHRACKQGSVEDVRALILKNDDPTAEFGSQGFTAAHICAEFNHTEALKVLLNAPNFLDLPDSLGRTACHTASHAGTHEILKLIAEHGGTELARAYFLVRDSEGKTALAIAAMKGHHRCINVILPYLQETSSERAPIIDFLWQIAVGITQKGYKHSPEMKALVAKMLINLPRHTINLLCAYSHCDKTPLDMLTGCEAMELTGGKNQCGEDVLFYASLVMSIAEKHCLTSALRRNLLERECLPMTRLLLEHGAVPDQIMLVNLLLDQCSGSCTAFELIELLEEYGHLAVWTEGGGGKIFHSLADSVMNYGQTAFTDLPIRVWEYLLHHVKLDINAKDEWGSTVLERLDNPKDHRWVFAALAESEILRDHGALHNYELPQHQKTDSLAQNKHLLHSDFFGGQSQRRNESWTCSAAKEKLSDTLDPSSRNLYKDRLTPIVGGALDKDVQTVEHGLHWSTPKSTRDATEQTTTLVLKVSIEADSGVVLASTEKKFQDLAKAFKTTLQDRVKTSDPQTSQAQSRHKISSTCGPQESAGLKHTTADPPSDKTDEHLARKTEPGSWRGYGFPAGELSDSKPDTECAECSEEDKPARPAKWREPRATCQCHSCGRGWCSGGNGGKRGWSRSPALTPDTDGPW